MKFKITFLIFFSASILSAQDKGCLHLTGLRDPSALEKVITSCDMLKKFATDPVVREEHKNSIHKKLALKLAEQIKQSSEELSLLTNFYNSNNKDLMMNNEDIKKQCQLEAIKETENCHGKVSKSNNIYKEKMLLLQKSLPGNAHTPFRNDQSLYGKIAGKFYSDLGIGSFKSKLQCPLNSGSESFLLRGQLDDISAENILQGISSDRIVSEKELFNKYAQLKMVQDTNNPEFIKKFKNYVKTKPGNISAKKYIADFFFNPENQPILTKTIASQCERMNSNINKFLCTDLTELGSLDNNASAYLFNKLNADEPLEDQYDLDLKEPGVLAAYGMQCLAKEKAASNKKPNEASSEQSVDNWYMSFVAKTRMEGQSSTSEEQDVNLFCSLYTCQDSKAKDQDSCKAGGPLSSSNLMTLSGCSLNPRSNNCTQHISKSIVLIENIEKLKKDASDKTNSNSTISKNNTEKEKGRLPAFAENYLGAEGTLKALGKEVTPISIAEKKQDIEERKVASAPSPTSTSPAPVTSTASRPMTVSNSESQASQEASNQIQNPEYKPTASASGNTAVKSAVVGKTETKTTTAANKIQNANSDSNPESSRLRSEMEKMLQDMKANGADGAINQNSPTVAGAAKTKSNNATVSNDATSAEEDRLKRWEQNLNDKSRNLDQYRRELDNRAYADRSVSQEDTSGKSATAAKNNNSLGVNDSSGGASGSNGSGAALSATKLAPAGQKGEQKNNTAAIIQSGKESSTLSVDELAQLSPDNLKILGIDSSKPFTLRVNFNAKTYEVPVKSLLYKGNNILGPVIDPKNKDLKEFLLKSPLFKPYHDYRMERGSLIDI